MSRRRSILAKAEDEDEVVQVQDDCFLLAEFQFSSLFFKFLLLRFLDLVLLGLQLLGRPSTVIPEGHLTNGHKDGKVPRQICWS